MNKEKVMQAFYELSDLQSICSKSIRQKAINKVKSEIYSKPLMPKVFDDWNIFDKSDMYVCLKCLGKLQYGECSTKVDRDLLNWIEKDFDNRYPMCIDAIINGYEVEK